jgi:hypothetical protein
LSSNYYNKTSTDTLLNAKANATDLTTTNTNVTNLTNNLSSNYYTKTETENEIDIALETIGSNIVPWNATFNTNSFNYALPYDETFVDATSVLNVNATNYNIVPAKKIYSYVENKVSTSITNALNSTRNYTFGNLGLLFYADDDASQTPVYTVTTNSLIVEYIGGSLIWVTLNFTTDVLNVPASYSGNLNMLLPFDVATSPQALDVCHGDMRCTLYDSNDNALNCDCVYVITKASARNYATWWRHVFFVLNRPTQTVGTADVYLNTSQYNKMRIMGSFTYLGLFPPAGNNNYSLTL